MILHTFIKELINECLNGIKTTKLKTLHKHIATLLFTLQIVAPAFAYQLQDRHVTVNNGVIINCSYKVSEGGNVIEIPSTLNGQTITGIGANAFSSTGNIKSLTLPSTLITIGQNAFANHDLTSLVIPNGVTTIDNKAFFGNEITTLTLPGSLQNWGTSTFENNEISTINFGSGIKSIGERAFANNKLSSLTLPSSLQTINKEAFTNNKLSTVNIPEGVSAIYDNAFYANSIATLTLPSTLITWGISVFETNNITCLTLASGISNIGERAFANNKLTTINLPTTITRINAEAFANNQLSSISLHEGVINLGQKAFFNNKLKTVSLPKSLQIWGESTFESNLITTIQFTNGLSSIGNNAFTNNQLSNISLPSSIKTIGSNAFKSNKISQLTIPEQLTTLGDGAFQNNMLTSLTISSNTTNINNYTFANNNLSTLNIPENVQIIGDYAFSNNKIKTINFPARLNKIGTYAFFNNQITNLILPNKLDSIAEGTFKSNQIATITLPSNIKTIGHYAFYGNKINSISFPSTLIHIGNYAFTFNKIQSITIPSALKSIGFDCFSYNSITSVSIPNNNVQIGNFAFQNNKIKTLSIPHGILIINEGVFQYNEITSLTLPTSIRAIGRNSFGNNQIKQLTLPDSIIAIGEYAFTNNQINTLSLPKMIKTITQGSFSCNNLISLSIPESVIRIDEDAFSANKSLTSIKFNNNLLRIRKQAFYQCALNSIELPKSLVYLGNNAFAQNAQINNITLPNSTAGNSWVDSKGLKHTTGSTISEFDLEYILEVPYTFTPADIVIDERGFIVYCGYFNNELNVGSVIHIPSSLNGKTVLGIEQNVFSNLDIVKISLPTTIRSINDYAFANSALLSITLPDSIETIGKYAFAHNNLNQVTFNTNGILFTIGAQAFNNNNVAQITLPKTNIAGHEYGGWRDGKKVVYKENLNITDFTTNYEALLKYTLTDNDVVVRNGKITSCSYDFKAKVIVIPSILDGQEVTEINDGISITAVFTRKGIVDINLPSTLKNIEGYAFSNNEIYSLHIPASVEKIGDCAFRNNIINNLTLEPNGMLKSIGNEAFGGLNITGEIIIPDSVNTIGDRAFASNNISSLIISPNSKLTHIGAYAFAYNQITSDITIPQGVTEIMDHTFYYNKIQKVTLNNNITDINEHAFNINPISSISKLHTPPTIPFLTWFIRWKDNNDNSYAVGHTITDFEKYYKAVIDQYLRVKIQVSDDNGNTLNNATIYFSDSIMHTNSAGVDSIAPVLRGTHQYKIEAPGFLTLNGQVDIQDDTFLKLVLIRQNAITINVIDTYNNPISQATITLSDTTLTTDNNGAVYVIKSQGNYPFTIRANGFSIMDTSVTMASSDTSITVRLMPSVITYLANNNSDLFINDTTKAVTYATINNPFSTSFYTFSHWNTQANNKGLKYEANDTISLPAGDLSLYAVWTPIQFNIAYNLNGGKNNPNNPTTYSIEDHTIQLLPATKTGLYFTAWLDSSNNRVTQIPAGTTGNIHLRAIYSTEPTYYINYHNIEMATNNNPVTYTRFETPYTFNQPTLRGYSFIGWFTDKDFTSEIKRIESGSTSELNLYAKWGSAIEYNITYKISGGTNSQSNPATYNIESETITLSEPQKMGYTFTGWFSDPLLKNQITSIATGSMGDTTVYAAWKVQKYKISYVLFGGFNSLSNPTSYICNYKTINFDEARKYDSKFEGWYTDEQFSNKIDSLPKHSTGDVQLFAKWETSYNLNFKITTDEVNPAKNVTIIVNNHDTLITNIIGQATIELPDQTTYDYSIQIDGIELSAGSGTINQKSEIISKSIIDAYMRWNDVIFCDNSTALWTSFEWTKGLKTISNEQFYHEPGGIIEGRYYLKVTTPSGKVYTWTKQYENKTFNALVYPNPAKTSSTVNINITGENNTKNYTLYIYNNSGMLVHTIQNMNASNQISINNQFAPGIYKTVITENDLTISTQQLLVR